MTRIHLEENGPVRAVVLDAEQGRALARSGVVTASPSPYAPGEWLVAPGDKVGVASIGGVEVWVAPKLTIQRLLFLVGYARDPRGWRDETAELDTRYGLVPAVAQALWRQCERALARGPLAGYREVEETGPVLRGRLRETDQLRRHFGLMLPLEIRYDDFGIDVPENRILLAAVTRMLTVPRIDAESRRRLSALRVRLAGVTTPVRGTRLPDWRPTRLNARYHTALRLAEIVWRATSPEHVPGAISANAFLFDMPDLFEDFVTTAFGEALGRLGPGRPRPQYPCHLDVGDAVRMRPDLVWTRDGAPVVVLDAKYKAKAPEADMYQMLAYCTVLGRRTGHLVYAGGEPARHRVRGTDIEIVRHVLDLDQPPADLLGQVAAIAGRMAERELAAA